MSWRVLSPNGQHKKGSSFLLCPTLSPFERPYSDEIRRFPIVAGLSVEWDHKLPPMQRVKSIRLLKNVGEDDITDLEDVVDFKEQEDGTRVEVKQKRRGFGEEVKRDDSKTYRVVSENYPCHQRKLLRLPHTQTCLNLLPPPLLDRPLATVIKSVQSSMR